MHTVYDASIVRPPLSGVQLAVRHQVLALLALTDQSLTTVFSLDRDIRDATRGHNCDVGPLPRACRTRAIRVAWQQVELPRLLRNMGADVLHAFAYTAPRNCPVPYVLNVHDVIALEHPEWCSLANRLHMRCLLAGSIRRAAAVIVSATAVADKVARLIGVPAERIHVVPLGVDAELFSRDTGRAPADSPLLERPYLLFVGNLEPKKGLDVLLDAYQRVADRLGLSLLVCGRAGWQCRSVVKRIREYSGPGEIHWIGRAPLDMVRKLYQRAFAFVFPSLDEGFGLPVLEAMAAGVPVVHSDHPVLMETAGGAGLACGLGDAESLGKQLLRLRDSRQLHGELIEKGRERAAAMTWERWATQASQITRELSGG